jgi:choline-sulfatase
MARGRTLIAFLCCAASLCSGQTQPHTAHKTPASPDVFLITIDTLRSDHVGCYGDKQIETPAIDSLARDGIRFANAFTASTITNTAHGSILTGLYPSEHGMLDFGSPLRPGVVTIAQALKRRGYATAAFIGAIILDSKTLAPGLDRGFDFYDNFPESAVAKISRYKKVERRGMDVVHRAEKWVVAHPRSARPRFVWVHLYDPHDPYDPPPPYRQKYAGRLYDGEIAYADGALGEFLRFLKSQQDYAPSLLVLTGDHGEGLGEHGEDTHGLFLYDSTTHIPMLIKLPWSPAGAGPMKTSGIVVEQQVRTVDILPSILDITHTPLTHSDGASLEPLWAERKDADRASIAETDYPLRFGWSPLKSVRVDEKKYIEAPRPEFYELKSDPGESKNLYAPWEQSVQQLRAVLADYREKVKNNAPSPGSISPQQVAELKAIGYWGNDRGSTTAPEATLLPDPKDKIHVQNALHIAMLAEEDGRIAQSQAAYEQALKLDPESPVALSQLGELDLKQHEYQRAAELLAHAGQLRPDAATALNEGKARYQLGDLEGARKALEASLTLSSGQYDARFLLGQVYTGLKEWPKAQDELEAAIFLDGKQPEARTALARVLLEEHQPQQALEQLRSASRFSPASVEIHNLIAQAQRELDHKE